VDDSTIVRNNIIACDIAGQNWGDSTAFWNGGSPTLYYSYNDIYAVDQVVGGGTCSDEGGNISAEAKFVDEDNGDFHLYLDSPCIDTGTPEGTDMGAYPFTGEAMTLILYTPDGGESWIEGEYYNITWESSGTPEGINLYYSIDAGATFTLISTDEPDIGIYTWEVANDPTSEARIRIEAVRGLDMVTDESNANFTIEASVLSLTLRNYNDTADYTTWEVGTDRYTDTVYIMTTLECVLVNNDGNVSADFSISAEASTWTLSLTGETGMDICVLMGLFNGNTQALEGDFTLLNDIITGTLSWATESGGGGIFEGTESGDNVPMGTGRKLYIYLKTPVAVTGGDEESITVLIGNRKH
jgi:hypothetical protein